MLRPYQQSIIRDTKYAWRKNRNICMVLPTGAGKTMTASSIIKDEGVPTAVIAHRQELVSQLSLALCAAQIPHRLICSDDVLGQILRVQRMICGRVWFDPSAPTFVAGVDTLIRRAGDPTFKRVKLWVTDECFPSGTQISTPTGTTPIEDIKVGDTVLAFDEVGKTLKPRKVVRLFKNAKPQTAVRLQTAGHHVIDCTNGHPFFTQRGWVNAADLTKGDILYEQIAVHEAGQPVIGVRLEDIQILEWDGSLGDFVYNIEVEELHTYVANGIVVHNCHHLLTDNKWGEAVRLFPEARGLGVTATPQRADGKGLGRHADGVFDVMLEGPTGQDLINMGYLSPYEIAVCKPEDLDFSHVEHGADGDFKQNQLRKATKASNKLVGDIVGQYLKRARGKLGITFCVDIEHAEQTVEAYKASGVPAALVTGGTHVAERAGTLERFRRREILQLVNVDLFGEGFDVPGVEVVSMARRTDSFALFSQQFGRSLRPVYAEGWAMSTDEERKAAIANGAKPKALIIDHVGNVIHHKLPTSRRPWTLDRRERKSRNVELSQEDKLKVCLNEVCSKPYPAFHVACPYCGHAPVATAKARSIEQVDGDLILLDERVLAEMHAEAERVMGTPHPPKGLPSFAVVSIIKRHGERAKAQSDLREAIAQWGGVQTHGRGLTVREAQKLFYLTFGVDVLAAQALGAREATELKERVLKCC